jgi:hypothetical protein
MLYGAAAQSQTGIKVFYHIVTHNLLIHICLHTRNTTRRLEWSHDAIPEVKIVPRGKLPLFLLFALTFLLALIATL